MLITSKFPGRCRKCGAEHSAGDRVDWTKGEKGVTCQACAAKAQEPAPPPRRAAPKRKTPLHPSCSECNAPALFSDGDMHFCREHGFAHLAELVCPRKLA